MIIQIIVSTLVVPPNVNPHINAYEHVHITCSKILNSHCGGNC